jgi:serine/threonine protein kinase
VNASAQDPLQRVGAVLDGRFRLDKLLGAGGMGAVYVATAADGGRCAIKLLLNETGNTDFLARFQREGQLAASLHAPNVARVHELAVDRTLGIPFIVMELLDGNDVEQLVERVGPVHPTTAVRITLQAAAGLVAAHAGGIVHRDVKPANGFLDRTATGIAV